MHPENVRNIGTSLLGRILVSKTAASIEERKGVFLSGLGQGEVYKCAASLFDRSPRVLSEGMFMEAHKYAGYDLRHLI